MYIGDQVSPLESFMSRFDMSREHELPNQGLSTLVLLPTPETLSIFYHKWKLLTPDSWIGTRSARPQAE